MNTTTTRAEGALNEVTGKVQNAVGQLTDDADLRLAGRARELSGKAQQLAADATTMVRQTTADSPLTTLAVVALASFAIGALWARGSD